MTARSKRTNRPQNEKNPGRSGKTPSEVAAERIHARLGKKYARHERRNISKSSIRQMLEEKANEQFQDTGHMPGENPSEWFAIERMVEEELKRREIEKPEKP
ncbi:MAG: hypothetical protein GF409_07470 [Candidatus Omnitrophica bacterium]|nr:hypothetical protein [Candidatus Omnitrophota bacterium]